MELGELVFKGSHHNYSNYFLVFVTSDDSRQGHQGNTLRQVTNSNILEATQPRPTSRRYSCGTVFSLSRDTGRQRTRILKSHEYFFVVSESYFFQIIKQLDAYTKSLMHILHIIFQQPTSYEVKLIRLQEIDGCRYIQNLDSPTGRKQRTSQK